MKKVSVTLLAALAAITLANNVQAQETQTTGSYNMGIDTKQFRFGVFVAPTIAWMKPTTDKTDDGSYAPTSEGSKVGFTYGLMAEYNFQENYAVVTGLQINMGGGKINSEYLGSNTTSQVQSASFNYRLNYFEIPVALKLRTDNISGFRFFGQLGLTTGFNIAKKATYDVKYYDDAGDLQTASGQNEKIKGTLAIAPIMFTMNIGAGAEYPLNDKLAAYFGLFFNNGFAPDATNPEKYKMAYGLGFGDANTRFNNFALRLGLFF
ncbi:MAG: porin family protein [Edaphocola sp.]